VVVVDDNSTTKALSFARGQLRSFLAKVLIEENQLILDVTDPRKENPDFVQAIVSAGGRIQFVTEINPGLEETYIKVVTETK